MQRRSSSSPRSIDPVARSSRAAIGHFFNLRENDWHFGGVEGFHKDEASRTLFFIHLASFGKGGSVKSHSIILIVFGAAGCATPVSRIEPSPIVLPPAAPAAPVTAVVDYTYQLLNPKGTGLAQVFDDGNSTYLKFQTEIPAGLMLFDENGKPVAFSSSGAAVMVSTVRTGWLVRTPTKSSYAQARSPERTARIESFEGAGSPKAMTLPTELAAARAEILAAQDRLAGLSAEVELAARGEGRVPLTQLRGEIEAVQTRLNGINATLVRTHFAFGSADLQLAAEVRQTLLEAARTAELVHIEGGTDSQGTPEFNRQLALKRAHQVRQVLIQGGIAEDKLTVSTVAQQYIASNETLEGRAKNRRVDVIFVPAAADAAVTGPKFIKGTTELALIEPR
jgi:outer membrane protein OmpA-like peptidoglycan-associated protein